MNKNKNNLNIFLFAVCHALIPQSRGKCIKSTIKTQHNIIRYKIYLKARALDRIEYFIHFNNDDAILYCYHSII